MQGAASQLLQYILTQVHNPAGSEMHDVAGIQNFYLFVSHGVHRVIHFKLNQRVGARSTIIFSQVLIEWGKNQKEPTR